MLPITPNCISSGSASKPAILPICFADLLAVEAQTLIEVIGRFSAWCMNARSAPPIASGRYASRWQRSETTIIAPSATSALQDAGISGAIASVGVAISVTSRSPTFSHHLGRGEA